MPPPVYAMPDDFVRLRLNAIPAGARKLYVEIEACKCIASCGMLVAMPGAAQIKDLVKTLREVKEAGVAAHIGASYYTRGTEVAAMCVDQNCSKLVTTTASALTSNVEGLDLM